MRWGEKIGRYIVVFFFCVYEDVRLGLESLLVVYERGVGIGLGRKRNFLGFLRVFRVYEIDKRVKEERDWG